MTMTGDLHHILLVEDNDDDAFLTGARSSRLALSTPFIIAATGRPSSSTWKISWERQPKAPRGSVFPDLILLDLKIPRLSGLEVLSWIRQHPVFRTLIVVALTSSSEFKDVETAYRLNINAYLVKPASLDEMKELAGAIRDFWLKHNYLMNPLFSPSLEMVR